MDQRNCPNPELLAGFALGTLPEEQAAAVAEHIEQCPDCDTTMERMESQGDTVIDRLRRAVPEPAEINSPECQVAVARAEAIVVSLKTPDDPAVMSASSLPPPSRQLGDYELLAKLGQGGMGAVYKARQTRLDKIVAIKVLPKERTSDPQARARFEREMKAVGRVSHANIVQAHDARDIDGTTILVMEYVDGLDLSKVVSRIGPLPIPEACELVRQAALGLQCAHENGLVHRDIKPSNLMLTRQGVVKILDLGLARLGTDQPGKEELTSAGQAMGTADYMAPEQATDSHAVDIRADIYSLGCTLYKLLTGQAPFSGTKYRTPLHKMMAHLGDPIPPLASHRSDVPKGLAAVVERMLAKEPSARYATPAALAEALAPFAAGADLRRLSNAVQQGSSVTNRQADAPGTAPAASSAVADTNRGAGFQPAASTASPPQPQAAAHFRRPPVRLLAVAGALGGALLLFGVVIYVKGKRIEVPDGSEVRINDQGEVAIKLPGEGNSAPSPRLLAGEGRLWQPCPAEDAMPGIIPCPAKIPGIHRWQVETAEPQGGAPLCAAWCPDGRLISFRQDCGQSLRLVSPDTLGTERILLGHRTPICDVSWSADGRTLASFGNMSQTCFWGQDGSLVRRLEIDLLANGSLSSDGSLITVRGWAGQCGILQADGKKVMDFPLSRAPRPILSPDGKWLAHQEERGGAVVLFRPNGSRGPTLEKNSAMYAWAPDSLHLAFARADGRISIWSTDGTEGPSFQAHAKSHVDRLAWSPDGRWLASGGDDKVVRLWRANGEAGPPLPDGTELDGNIAWSPDGRYLASIQRSGSAGAVVRVWQVDTELKEIAQASHGIAQGVCWSPDSKRVAFGSIDNGLGVLHLDGTTRAGSRPGTSPVSRIAWSPDGGSVAVLCSGGEVTLHKADGRVVKRLSNCEGFTWLPAGNCLALKGKNTVRHWEMRGAEEAVQETFVSPGKWDVYTRTWSRDGQLAARAEGKIVRLWKADGTALKSLEGHGAEVLSIAWQPDGKGLASLDRDGEVRMWKSDGTLERRFQAEKNSERLVFRPDGMRLAVVGRNSTYDAQIWTLEGRLERKIPYAASGVSVNCEWSPDGERFVSTTYHSYGGLQTWNRDGTDRRRPLSQDREIACHGWSPNSRGLTFGTLEGVVYHWDMDANAAKWIAIRFDDGTHATFTPAGQILDGDRQKLASQLVYVVQRTPDGPQELWTYQQFEEYVKKHGLDLGASKGQALQAASGTTASPRPLAGEGPDSPPLAVSPFDAKQGRQHQETWAKRLGVSVEITNSIGMKFVLIPPGEFDMGSSSQEIERLLVEAKSENAPSYYIQDVLPREGPRHHVRITRPFYLSKYEVTHEQYDRVINSSGSAHRESGENLPVEGTGWNDAMQFCRRLSELPGEQARRYRLASEAEWEYACRAGTTTRYSFGDDASLLDQHAWWKSNSENRLHPVGQKAPNAFGLCDMLGNVAEWCIDAFAEYRDSASSDPVASGDPSIRVLRGGTYGLPPRALRSAGRARTPANHGEWAGVRVLLELPGIGGETRSASRW